MTWWSENLSFTLYYKVLFMIERNPQPTEALQDIKQLMQRSSRFISLSGLSGIAAGVCALVAAWIARNILKEFFSQYPAELYRSDAGDILSLKLAGLGVLTFMVAFVLSFLFTSHRAKKMNLPVWDYTSRRLLWNVMVPMIAGGFFIIGMLQYGEWRFVAPACLIFYGLALINGSKYTLSDIRYLGYLEIMLGVISMWFIGYGLLFWAIGFGVLHIIYGTIMWFKYERNPEIN
jgi:hypothetical protein